MQTALSLLRLAAGFIYVAVVVAIILIGCVFLLPFGRIARIHWSNRLGIVLGRGVVAIAGSKLTVHGAENAAGPAIFANNHTSNLDAFLTIWLTPQGTVGLAKKQIIYYPFYGLAWVLCGQPTVDRSNPQRAHASMKALGEFVRAHDLSVCMLPEGTRSRDGRLLPFKKGIVHLAVQTELPVVPMVTVGAAGAWNKGQWVLRPRDIHVYFLPPVDTSSWSLDETDRHLEDLRNVFVHALPPEMRSARDVATPAAA